MQWFSVFRHWKCIIFSGSRHMILWLLSHDPPPPIPSVALHSISFHYHRHAAIIWDCLLVSVFWPLSYVLNLCRRHFPFFVLLFNFTHSDLFLKAIWGILRRDQTGLGKILSLHIGVPCLKVDVELIGTQSICHWRWLGSLVYLDMKPVGFISG